MIYLIFVDQTTADTRNHQEALSRGCTETSTTQFWWSAISHTDGRSALQIPDSDVSGLTAQEHAALVDYDTMDVDGWFPVGDMP